jgi:hypothetical protein
MNQGQCHLLVWVVAIVLTGCSTMSDVGLAVASKDLTVVQRVIAPDVLDTATDVVVDGLNTIEINSGNLNEDMSVSTYEKFTDETLCRWAGYKNAEIVIANRNLKCPDVFSSNHSESELTQLFRCLSSVDLLKQKGRSVTLYEYRLINKPVPRSPRSAFLRYSKESDKFVRSVFDKGGEKALVSFVKKCIRERQMKDLADG